MGTEKLQDLAKKYRDTELLLNIYKLDTKHYSSMVETLERDMKSLLRALFDEIDYLTEEDMDAEEYDT